MPDLDESVFHWRAGGAPKTPKSMEAIPRYYGHDENGTPRCIEDYLLLRLPDVWTDEPITDISGTFSDFGGSGADHL